jgi:lipopolysaccharide/colanic/teichoic acid biosynthesis glycosyltransferase
MSQGFSLPGEVNGAEKVLRPEPYADILIGQSAIQQQYFLSREDRISEVIGAENKYLISKTKRTLDVVISLLAILFLFPLMTAIYVLVTLTSSGPALYRQKRGGFKNQPFHILKFRSMYVTGSEGERRQATRGDKRITPLGHFLRQTSADELPQVFNVLAGHMSIVGPRPHATWHDEACALTIKDYRKRYLTRPGITGLAQVMGLRGETQTADLMQQRVNADLQYIQTASLALDLKILFVTVVQVLLCHKAY